jgi:putative transposase
MVIDGVSTAKVKKIVGKLDKDLSFFKSTINRIIMKLDPIIKKWREQRLNEHYIYVILDAIYIHTRENGEVIKRPVLISIGVDKNGYMKVHVISLGYQEDEATWRSLIKALKERSLISADLTISDAKKGFLTPWRKSSPVLRIKDV